MEKKNSKLRELSYFKLTEIFDKIKDYYVKNSLGKEKIKKLKAIRKNFDTTLKQDNIMTELTEMFSNKNNDFLLKLDSNQNLLGFNNGVYDLEKFEFRMSNPSDYVSMTVGYDYNDKYSDKYENLKTFLGEILPIKEDLEYTLTYLSTMLYGNILQNFSILTGVGRNGKSKLMELIELVMGDYFASTSGTMFTRPQPDDEKPVPCLISLIKARVVVSSEPEKKDKINTGFVKFITGKDKKTVRTLYKNIPIKFMANFITLFVCNDIPECDGNTSDVAFNERLKCINFPTKFTDTPKLKNEKMINYKIDENFPDWKNDFMLMMIEYYKKFMQTKKLTPPPNVLKWTNMYKQNGDMHLQFINECTKESRKHTRTCVMYDKYKEWHKITNTGQCQSFKNFLEGCKKHLKIGNVKIDKNVYKGFKNREIICDQNSDGNNDTEKDRTLQKNLKFFEIIGSG